MTWPELGTLVASIIVSLGGGGAIVLGLSNWIGRMLADRYVEKLKHEIQQDLETYKTRLRKSEFLFQKEFEAASGFITLRRSLMPKYRFPEMEWHDACEDFAGDFGKVEKKLEQYLATHGAALNDETLERLSGAIDQVSAGKFKVSCEDVSLEGIKIAGKVMDELEEVEKQLHAAVRSQSASESDQGRSRRG